MESWKRKANSRKPSARSVFLVKEAILQIDELRLTVVECLSYPEQIYVDLVLNQDHFQFI